MSPSPIIIDPISVERINKLHPLIRQEVMDLVTKCYESNVPIRIVQSLRTIEEQDALYAQGRTKPGPVVTKARGGSSWHNYGLAIDFALLKNGKEIIWDRDVDLDKDGKKDWMEVVEIFKAGGFGWGGDWISLRDYPHFDKTFGISIKTALTKYRNNEVDSEKYILIA
jgi:peptidoglycan L-alanyl-D-glutamate endopeptidase CwlK